MRRADGYYAQFAVKTDLIIKTKPTGKAIGLDLGIKYFLADSNGNTENSPKFYRKAERQLNRANRKKSKKYRKGAKPQSKNYSRARKRYARKHLRVSRQRKEYCKRVAYSVIQSNDLVAYEDLNVKGMVRNRHLSKSISDAGWFTFRQWLEYFGHKYGKVTVTVDCHPDNPLLALAFKITDEDTGQLTYTRLYSGTLRQGDTVKNSRTGKRVRIGRLVRMHANHRQEITEATAGDIIALMGIDCASGDTLCDLGSNLCLEGIVVPEPVVTLSIIPKHQDDVARMSKALHRFTREDPTFRVTVDPESNQTLISGMGELHLAIYIERMKREYKAEVDVGAPAVAYRETISQGASFDYKLKKHAGGCRDTESVSGAGARGSLRQTGFTVGFKDNGRVFSDSG